METADIAIVIWVAFYTNTCNNYNEKVFRAFERYGVTPHVVNFRHRYFWDGGLHCITLDLNRKGKQQDCFPERKQSVIDLGY